MKNIEILAITKEYGCSVYTNLILPEDYTMNMVVSEVKRLGYCGFMIIGEMKTVVYLK